MIFTPYTTTRIFHDEMARPVLRIFFVDLYFTIHPCIIAYNDAKRWALLWTYPCCYFSVVGFFCLLGSIFPKGTTEALDGRLFNAMGCDTAAESIL
jgi:hypothetical protein